MKDRIRMICLPYAGGSGAIFYELKKMINPTIELKTIDYAGRGCRFNEPLDHSVKTMVEDICAKIEYDIKDSDYFLLGYSLGGLLAYELIKLLMKKGLRLPCHVFFMACHAPHNRYGNYCFHTLSDEKLIEALYCYGGFDKNLLADKMLLDMFIPIIKNDFMVYEQYDISQEKVILPIDFTIVNGDHDGLIDRIKVKEWSEYAGGRYQFFFLNANHFFIKTNLEEIAYIILHQINNYKSK